MYDTKVHSAGYRIVSISQPSLRLSVSGKVKTLVEFWGKLGRSQ